MNGTSTQSYRLRSADLATNLERRRVLDVSVDEVRQLMLLESAAVFEHAEHVDQGGESMSFEQRSKLGFHPPEIVVVIDSNLQVDSLTGLVCIDLPRMEIEDRRLALGHQSGKSKLE